MNQEYSKRGMIAAILTISFLQMATNAVASILASIAATFPDASVSAVQYLMTFPNLLVVAVSMVMLLAIIYLLGRSVRIAMSSQRTSDR